MKIWYQAYNTSARVDPKWRYYEEACERYIVKVARPDTQIHFAWLEKRAPKMLLSKYIQYMHLAEVIEFNSRVNILQTFTGSAPAVTGPTEPAIAAPSLSTMVSSSARPKSR